MLVFNIYILFSNISDKLNFLNKIHTNFQHLIIIIGYLNFLGCCLLIYLSRFIVAVDFLRYRISFFWLQILSNLSFFEVPTTYKQPDSISCCFMCLLCVLEHENFSRPKKRKQITGAETNKLQDKSLSPPIDNKTGDIYVTSWRFLCAQTAKIQFHLLHLWNICRFENVFLTKSI